MKTRLYLSLKRTEIQQLLNDLGELDDRSAAGIKNDYPALAKLRDALKEFRQ